MLELSQKVLLITNNQLIKVTSFVGTNLIVWVHSVHWGINPPSKTPPRLSCQAPPPP